MAMAKDAFLVVEQTAYDMFRHFSEGLREDAHEVRCVAFVGFAWMLGVLIINDRYCLDIMLFMLFCWVFFAGIFLVPYVDEGVVDCFLCLHVGVILASPLVTTALHINLYPTLIPTVFVPTTSCSPYRG